MEAHIRLERWRRWTLHHIEICRHAQNIKRKHLAKRVAGTRRVYNLARKLQDKNPPFYRLKVPSAPHQASMGAVVAVFATPIVFAIFAFLASWTSVGVLLAWMLPSGAIFAALLTPLADPVSNLHHRHHQVTSMTGKILDGLGNAVKATIHFCTEAVHMTLSGINTCLCGRFQEVFAVFVQICMGLAAGMQIRDALIVIDTKPAASLIGLLIAAVQLPDFFGWLCGEVWKIDCVIRFIDSINAVVDRACRSVEAKAEQVVQEFTAIMSSLKDRFFGNGYKRLEEEQESPLKRLARLNKEREEAEAAKRAVADVEAGAAAGTPEPDKSKGTEESSVLQQLTNAVNDVGLQVRQSPFKMLTAVLDFIMMLDEIEATREGSSPWYYLTIDAFGFLAAFMASTGFVRQVTREKEYNEGLAHEAARMARKTLRMKAEMRLKEALAPGLLDMDADEILAAATQAENAELAKQVVADARDVAQKAVEAQRQWRLDEEARRKRCEIALKQLMVLSSPQPLDIDCDALQAAIEEAELAGVGAPEVELASQKKMRAFSAQEIRALAEASLEEAMIPAPVEPGTPLSPLLRLNLIKLDEALKAAGPACVRPHLIKRAQDLRSSAAKAQQSMTAELAFVLGKFKKKGNDVRQREAARAKLAEAERRANEELVSAFTKKNDESFSTSSFNVSRVSRVRQDAHAAQDSDLGVALQELQAAIHKAQAVGIDVTAATETATKIHEIMNRKINALDRLVPAMRAVEAVLPVVQEKSQSELQEVCAELDGAIELARQAELDASIQDQATRLYGVLREIVDARSIAAASLKKAIDRGRAAIVAREMLDLVNLIPTIGNAVNDARAVKLNEEGPPSIIEALKQKDQMAAFAQLLQAHGPAREALAPFDKLRKSRKTKFTNTSDTVQHQGPAMMALRNAGNAFAAVLESAKEILEPKVIEKDVELLTDMQLIYLDYDKALTALENWTAKCDAAMKRLQKTRDFESLKVAVEQLEKAVFDARAANVEIEHIRNAQKSLTTARASLRGVKDKAASSKNLLG